MQNTANVAVGSYTQGQTPEVQEKISASHYGFYDTGMFSYDGVFTRIGGLLYRHDRYTLYSIEVMDSTTLRFVFVLDNSVPTMTMTFDCHSDSEAAQRNLLAHARYFFNVDPLQ